MSSKDLNTVPQDLNTVPKDTNEQVSSSTEISSEVLKKALTDITEILQSACRNGAFELVEAYHIFDAVRVFSPDTTPEDRQKLSNRAINAMLNACQLAYKRGKVSMGDCGRVYNAMVSLGVDPKLFDENVKII